MKRLFFSLILLAWLAAACQAPTAAPATSTSIPLTSDPTTQAPTNVPPTSGPPTGGPATAAPTTVPPVPTLGGPTATTVAPTSTPVSPDMTPAQSAAINVLATRLQIGRDQITVVSTEAVAWPDGCLGVALPGVTCARGPVPGFRIKLSAAARDYEYHTNQDGSSVLSTDQALSQPLRVAVRLTDNSVQVVDTGFGASGARLNPGLLPMGGAVGNTAYVLDFKDQPQAQIVSLGAANPLPFVQQPNYGLAVWPGQGTEKPRLAWATSPTGDPAVTQLFYANVDGTGLTAALTETISSGTPPYQLVAEIWSADGQGLYFSREPYGIGGYIPFGGASSLYRYNLADGSVTDVLPSHGDGRLQTCLDDVSPDFTLAAGSCTDLQAITVYSLSGGAPLTITAPSAVTDFRLAGSARFSPDGQRVAFALAKGDPSAEQGYVAVSDGLGGQSNFLTTIQGGYYTVVAWLDSHTLLLQFNTLACTTACTESLWTIGVDGSNLTRLTDGTFLTFVAGN